MCAQARGRQGQQPLHGPPTSSQQHKRSQPYGPGALPQLSTCRRVLNVAVPIERQGSRVVHDYVYEHFVPCKRQRGAGGDVVGCVVRQEVLREHILARPKAVVTGNELSSYQYLHKQWLICTKAERPHIQLETLSVIPV
jgi:hypothetical protein